MKHFFSVLVCCAGLLLSACGSDKAEYRFAPEIGKALNYEVRTETEMELPSEAGGDQDITMTMKMELTPTSTENGITTISTKILDMTTEAAGQSMPAEQKEMMNQVFASMRIITKVNEQGAVVGKPQYEGVPAEMAAAMMQNNQMNLSDEMKYFPKHAIGEGDTWKSEVNDATKKVNITYTLEKLDEKVFVVHSEGTLTLNPSEGVSTTMELDGTVTYDRATGVNVAGGTKIKIKAKVEAGGQTMPMKMTMTM